MSEVVERTEVRMDRPVVGHVVAVVAERAREDGKEPNGPHPEVPDVGELLAESTEIADAVSVGVVESAHVNRVENEVTPPGELHLAPRLLRVARIMRPIGKNRA